MLRSRSKKRTHRRYQKRRLRSIFGEVEVKRIGYGGRGIKSLQPLDGELNLPKEVYSHGLRKKIAQEVSKNGFDEVVKSIKENTGEKVPKRQVEELGRLAATDFEEFYQQRERLRNEQLKQSGEIVVITADAKGVTMLKSDLKEATRKRGEKQTQKGKTRLSKGEKRNSKRMATVMAVYTIKPWIRQPAEIVSHQGKPDKEKNQARPKPENKRVWASLEQSPQQLISSGFTEAARRDPQKQKRWCALVDGNPHQIQLLQECAAQQKVELTIVLDLIHVLEYVWGAANSLWGETHPQRESWVKCKLLMILEGNASLAAATMKASATKRRLEPQQRQRVDKCAQYLLKYRDFLRYNLYLAQGLPIATGVIEGACRYLVKDRMALTGARWRLAGAEAVLRLRALIASGDFELYWQFHLQQELLRNHHSLYLHGVPLMKSLRHINCPLFKPLKHFA